MSFVVAGDQAIRISDVRCIDISRLESEGYVYIEWAENTGRWLRGTQAVEAIMRLHPALLEGRRLRWRRGAWAFHNLVAHPLLQVLSWVGMTRLGMRIHDWTVPVPANDVEEIDEVREVVRAGVRDGLEPLEKLVDAVSRLLRAVSDTAQALQRRREEDDRGQ